MFFTLKQDKSDAKEVAAERAGHPFPWIIIKGDIREAEEVYLAAENQLLCLCTDSLVEATLGLMAVYYVFMFNYPAGLNNFYLYLQRCILQINDGTRLPSTIINLVNSIDSMSKSGST